MTCSNLNEIGYQYSNVRHANQNDILPSVWCVIAVTSNKPNDVSKYRQISNSVFRLTPRTGIEVHITSPLWWESIIGGLASQRASNAENVSMSWCPYVLKQAPSLSCYRKLFYVLNSSNMQFIVYRLRLVIFLFSGAPFEACISV